MDFLLTAAYVLLFSMLIRHLKFFSEKGISKNFLLSVFLIKSVLGILYCYIHLKKYGGGDTLNYFKDGNIIFNSLFDNPLHYLHLTFGANGGVIPKEIESYVYAMGFWGDTGAYMVVRFNALVRLFSFGSFYVHTVFMAFVSFMGLWYLYKALMNEVKGNVNQFVIASIFLIPSVLFWTSGVHKEGLLIFGLGVFFYSISLISVQKKLTGCIGLMLSSALVFLARDFIFLLLLPGFIAYLISIKVKRYPLLVFISVYSLSVIASSLIHVLNGFNFLEIIAKEQMEFITEGKGNSDVYVSLFKPTLQGLLFQLPQALKNVFLGPYLEHSGSRLNLLVVIENSVLLFATFLSLAFISFKKPKPQPLLIWFFFFGFSLAVLIGCVVPNVGAIVRYRSLALPFLFIVLAMNIRKGK